MRVGSLGQEDPLEEGMQPITVFLPGASHGQKSLKGYIVHGVSKRRTGPNRLSARTHTVGATAVMKFCYEIKTEVSTLGQYLNLQNLTQKNWTC